MKAVLVAALLISSVSAFAESPLTPDERFAQAEQSAVQKQIDQQKLEIGQIEARLSLAVRMILKIEKAGLGNVKALGPAKLSTRRLTDSVLMFTDGTECSPDAEDCTNAKKTDVPYSVRNMTEYFGDKDVVCKAEITIGDIDQDPKLISLNNNSDLSVQCRKSSGEIVFEAPSSAAIDISTKEPSFGTVTEDKDLSGTTVHGGISYKPEIKDRSGNVIGYVRYRMNRLP